jgi:hypothetical protein
MPATPRVLVLYANAWDRLQLGRDVYRGKIEFSFLGDDLFTFPESLKLVAFSSLRFLDDVVERIEREDFAGVMSTDEYIGAILAAAAAGRTDRPGNRPEHIIAAQHKYYSREAQRSVAPDITPRTTLVPLRDVATCELALPFPFFVKPVKGTFSLFAARVDDRAALVKHMGFNVFERLLLGRVTKPFNDLVHEFTDFEYDANYFIGEELIEGDQVTVDGFVWAGDVEVMGIVDSVMFPGTNIFERFEYPSRLPPAVQERMAALTREIMRGLGWQNGQFNVELFYDRSRDRIAVIEINPRMSYQFADLYEYVDGSNSYDVLIDLTLGRRPRFVKGGGSFRYAASFVLRTFEGKKIVDVPDPAEVQSFSDRYDEATIKLYGKPGQSMRGEMKAIGSYRHAIVNVAANSLLDLFAIHQDALEKLPFTFA